MPHKSFLDTVNRIVKNEYGCKYTSDEAAEKDLIGNPEKLTAMAVLELIARFNKFVDSMTTNKWRQLNQLEERPDNAQLFEGKKFGDMVFQGDFEDGIDGLVIVSRDKEGFPIVCRCRERFDLIRPTGCYATGCYDTIEEAIREAATLDLEYHKARADFAARALEALDAGSDISEFAKGYPDE